MPFVNYNRLSKIDIQISVLRKSIFFSDIIGIYVLVLDIQLNSIKKANIKAKLLLSFVQLFCIQLIK